MFLTQLLTLLLTLAPIVTSQGQITFDSIHNATSIVGTWSSGSKHVMTGPGFANPTNRSFTYPQTTGISYSFTADGFAEIARYRMFGNGAQPTCITGVLNWFHGTYTLQSNGSITMLPTGLDGYQQIQDPCAAVSNFVESYNNTEYYPQWRIFIDPTDGPKLHLFQFDGSPLPPQFLISTSPNMLPTGVIRNTTATPGKTVLKRELVQRNGAAGQHLTIGAAGLLLLALWPVLAL